MYRLTSMFVDFGISDIDLLILSRVQRKFSFYEPTVRISLDIVPQLYAEPSLILYIRTKFDLSNVVIVSPDAGGAKRCVD